MRGQLVIAIATELHNRLTNARELMGVYYDEEGVFRVSPASGIRFVQISTAFPDCVIGLYNSKIPLDDFEADLRWFCRGMGLREEDES